jgi:hypothetical protein
MSPKLGARTVAPVKTVLAKYFEKNGVRNVMRMLGLYDASLRVDKNNAKRPRFASSSNDATTMGASTLFWA